MLYVILIAAALIFAIILYDKPLAKLTFKNGELASQHGHVDKHFMVRTKEIAHKQPFSGVIKIYKYKKQYRVKFSKAVPNKLRHELRNILPGAKPHPKKR